MNTLKKPLKLIVSVVTILLLVIILFLSFNFRLDLSPWRQTILETANKSLPYRLSLNGDMEVTLGYHPSVRLSDIKLTPKSAPDKPVATIEKIAGPDISALAPVSFKTSIIANPESIHMDTLDVAFADSQMTGVVHIDHKELPIVEGSLNISRLDLAPWLKLAENAESPEPEPAAPEQNDEQADDENRSLTTVIKDWLTSAEIDFDFSMAQLTGLPVEINDTRLAITMNNGRLHAPASLSLADTPLSGEITMTVNDDNHVDLNSSLPSHAANIGPLFSALLKEENKGHVENLNLEINAQGATVSDLLRHTLLDFELGVDQPDFGRVLMALNMVGDIDLALDKARFALKPLVKSLNRRK